MIVYTITISERPNGMAIDGKTTIGPGTEQEKIYAGCLDVAFRTTAEYVTQAAGRGEIIEGKNIESIVRDRLKKFRL